MLFYRDDGVVWLNPESGEEKEGPDHFNYSSMSRAQAVGEEHVLISWSEGGGVYGSLILERN